MSPYYCYTFQGELSGPLYPNEPVLACNFLMPLNSENDYALEATFVEVDAKTYVLPVSHYKFLSDIISKAGSLNLEFDLIIVKLGAPSPVPIPPALLAPNVFITLDGDTLLDTALTSGKARVLYIADQFRIRGIDDVGNNQFEMSIHYNQVRSDELSALSLFFAERNIKGTFTCHQ